MHPTYPPNAPPAPLRESKRAIAATNNELKSVHDYVTRWRVQPLVRFADDRLDKKGKLKPSFGPFIWEFIDRPASVSGSTNSATTSSFSSSSSSKSEPEVVLVDHGAHRFKKPKLTK